MPAAPSIPAIIWATPKKSSARTSPMIQKRAHFQAQRRNDQAHYCGPASPKTPHQGHRQQVRNQTHTGAGPMLKCGSPDRCGNKGPRHKQRKSPSNRRSQAILAPAKSWPLRSQPNTATNFPVVAAKTSGTLARSTLRGAGTARWSQAIATARRVSARADDQCTKRLRPTMINAPRSVRHAPEQSNRIAAGRKSARPQLPCVRVGPPGATHGTSANTPAAAQHRAQRPEHHALSSPI